MVVVLQIHIYEAQGIVYETMKIWSTFTYLDFVTAYQAGIYNVIALGSASFTDELIDLLEDSPYISKVAFALDNDETGIKRTKTLIDRLKARTNLEKKYAVAFIKNGVKDLDEAINAGVKTLEEAYDVLSLFEYSLQFLVNTYEDEREILDMIIPTILQEDSRLTREEMVTELTKHINQYSKDTILREINFREDFKKQNVSKKFEKLIDKFKAEALSEPMAINTLSRHLQEELKKVQEAVYHKKSNLFESTLLSIRAAEELKADKESRKKIKTGYRIFDDANLAKTNVITICGRANSFKTSLFVNAAMNLLNKNDNTMLFYYSTDDPLEKIINDFIACEAGLIREYVADPLFYPELGKEVSNSKESFQLYQAYLKAFTKIETFIKEKRLIIKQSSDMTTWNEFENALAELNEDQSLKGMARIAIVDSVNKIETPMIQEDNARIAYLSERTKKAAEMYGFIFIQNIELRKIPDFHLVSLQDLRGSVSATRCIMKSYACC